MTLFYILLAEPLREDVAHVLGLERDGKGVVSLVLCHGSNGDVFRIGEVRFGRAVYVANQLSDFTNSIRTIVEEEEGIVVCSTCQPCKS